jgi:hypothetical protein
MAFERPRARSDLGDMAVLGRLQAQASLVKGPQRSVVIGRVSTQRGSAAPPINAADEPRPGWRLAADLRVFCGPEMLLRAMTAAVLVSLLGPAIRCASADDVNPKTLALLEAVVRFGLTPSEVRGAHQVFLQIDGAAPSFALLGRLSNVAHLKSVAECPRIESYARLVAKPAHGDVVLNVWNVELRGKQAASVWIGHSEGPTSGMACQEYFERTSTGWKRRDQKPSEGRSCGIS